MKICLDKIEDRLFIWAVLAILWGFASAIVVGIIGLIKEILQ